VQIVPGVLNGPAPRGHSFFINEHVGHVSQVSDLRPLGPLVLTAVKSHTN